jgi:Argonaute siRNA chaperone (ARC) complex subunit Arb1
MEAEEIYGDDVGIVNKLEIAIQRYMHNRKFDPDSKRCIEAYFKFGGVSTSPKPFARLDRQHAGDLDVPDTKAALATHHIMPDKFDTTHWRLDFDHTSKGFLSNYFPHRLASVTKQPEMLVETCCKVLVNFFNYLLYHNVFKEQYLQESITKAKNLANIHAKPELITLMLLPNLLPGLWSKACAKLWDLNWNVNTMSFGDGLDTMTAENARSIFIQGLQSCTSQTLDRFKDLYITANPCEFHKRISVLFKGYGCVELVSIHTKPNNDPRLPSVGFSLGKPWYEPGNDAYDIPEASHGELPPYMAFFDRVMEVWIDDIGLSQLKPGMRVKGLFMHLDFKGLGRIWVMTGRVQAFCSFHTITRNDLDGRNALRAPHLEREKRNIEVYDPNSRCSTTRT